MTDEMTPVQEDGCSGGESDNNSKLRLARHPVIVWVGFHEEGAGCIPALYVAGHTVTAIFTLQQSALVQRSGAIDYQPIAERYTIPLHRISSINDASTTKLLADYSPDLICVVGWSEVLGTKVLATAPLVLGTHASLLPANRGSAPVNWALIRNLASSGNTLMRLNSGIDRGDILGQESFQISAYDSCATLYRRIASSNERLLLQAIAQMQTGGLQPHSQLESASGNLLPRRRPEDGLVDWQRSNYDIYHFIRAQTRPYPGAYALLEGREIRIWKASVRADLDDAGRLSDSPVGCADDPMGSGQRLHAGDFGVARISFDPFNCAVQVFCGEGSIDLHEVELDDGTLLRGSGLVEFFNTRTGFDSDSQQSVPANEC